MVDTPIQQGNWFSMLRAWRAGRLGAARPGTGGGERPGRPEATPPRPAGAVDLSRLAMAAPFED